MSRMDDKLKPCPFCGGKVSLLTNMYGSHVECMKCLCETRTSGTEEGALVMCNHRHYEVTR